MRPRALLLAGFFAWTLSAFGQGSGAAAFEPAVVSVDGAPGAIFAEKQSTPSLRMSRHRLTASETHTFPRLTPSERALISADGGAEAKAEGALRIGVGRRSNLEFRIGSLAANQKSSRTSGGLLERGIDGRLYWTAAFSSGGAHALRLHLEAASFPAGSKAFIYSDEGEIHGPYGIDTAAGLWTNAIFADTAYLELQLPTGVDASSARIRVTEIAHIEHPSFKNERVRDEESNALASCFVDISCRSDSDFQGLSSLSRAVAGIIYQVGSLSYACTGALVNTSRGNSIPYFLTANHCISTPESAATMEAFWDYRSASCNGPVPSRSTVKRTLGATLLATGSQMQGDFSLLQLSQQPPSGRFYLGWSTDEFSTTGAVQTYRVAHPDGLGQSFSRHVISASPVPTACSSLPQGTYIYSKNQDGTTKGGSSGAAVVIADGVRLIGQLFGKCGTNTGDACDGSSNSAVDGAFARYYPAVATWLNPSRLDPCTPNATDLCLLDGRFRVTLVATDHRTGTTAIGQAVPHDNVFGYFALPALTGSMEPVVFAKVLDGRPVTGKYWVFYGGLTDVKYTLTVLDTVTASQKSYTKAPGSFCGDADTQAFEP